MSDAKPIVFAVTTGYGARTKVPYVQVLIEAADFMCQMSPEDARSLALNLLSAAESSEQDAFFVEFLRERIGAGDGAIAALLQDFREWREKGANDAKP